MSADEGQEFQPGDVVEVTIPIRHAANLAAVWADFVHDVPPRDVVQIHNQEAELFAGDEPGTTWRS